MVNNEHTKIGVTKVGFKKTLDRNFVKTFDGEVELVPVAFIDADDLDVAKAEVRRVMLPQFRKVDNTRDSFHCRDHEKFRETVVATLVALGIPHQPAL